MSPMRYSTDREPVRLRDALGDLMGMLEPHLDEHDGRTYCTPSLIDHDDGKEED